MRLVRTLLTITAASAALAIATPANAAITLVGVFPGNDCTGGFSDCYAYPGGTHSGPIDLGSPTVFKYDNEGGGIIEVSDDYDLSITGEEFDIDYFGGTNTLEFVYDPEAGDPDIHYVAVKQARWFALFYDSDPITSGSFALDTYFPDNPGYSHITFFNSGSTAVPEPATWALMMLGFGGIGWAMRRRRAAGQQRLNLGYN